MRGVRVHVGRRRPWQGLDGPGKGYQFARAQLQTPDGSYVLGGFLHPGKTVSVHCLHESVELVEAELGRPRRRVEVLAGRIARAEQELADLDGALAERQRGSIFVRRRCKRLEDQCAARRAEIAALQEHQARLAAENATNPAPRRSLLRLDGGFGDAAHLAWLYEQGYAAGSAVSLIPALGHRGYQGDRARRSQ